ncbi:MAG: TonB-dependent receptor [Paludibacteraceae bacterium]|nr:TonB-dependent receptor [Paludibacteraceae bacterium]
MKRLYLTLLASLLIWVGLQAQTSLKGVIVADDSHEALSGVKVTLANQNISTTTNAQGEFALIYLEAMEEELILEADGYLSDILLVLLEDGKQTDLGQITLKQDIQTEMREEIILNLSEADLNDDEGKSQSMASGSSASQDVFFSTSSYAWSSARYRGRGYDQTAEMTYINGISFNGAERGTFNYSSLGGLNDASRNKEITMGIEANNFAFGGIGEATNILMDATKYAQGWKVGFAAANRNYKGRVTATYASGLLENGWAYVGQIAYRYSPAIGKNIIGAGSDYNSFGYFFSAEKRINDHHKLSLLTFGSPTERGQSAAVTQEVYHLTGSINYNPYWGFQNGQVRNSRIVKAFDPTVIASYEWKIDDKQLLRLGVGYHYSLYSNSALTFFNAPDPRPDYYRNLPSFLYDGQVDGNGNLIGNKWTQGESSGDKNWDGTYSHWNGVELGSSIDQKTYDNLLNMWRSGDPTTTQINWDALYAANYANNYVNPTGSARYMVERRHNDISEASANLLYRNEKREHLKVTAGLELKESQGIHYKTVDDLLGGKQWVDLDPFADRDIKELADNIGMTQEDILLVRQNNITGATTVAKDVHEKEKFGYDYTINMFNAKLWAQNEWKWNDVEFYYGLQLTVSEFDRTSRMLNGRAWYLAQLNPNYAAYYLGSEYENIMHGTFNGLYKGWQHVFIDPSFKAGVTYKFNGHNQLRLNAIAQTVAPLARDAYVSSRVHDRVVDNIYTHDHAHNLKEYYAASEKRVSYDLTYEFNFPVVRGRVTAYQTHFWGGTELNGYYDDEASTFVNQSLSNINKVHRGLEFAAAFKCGKYITLTPIIAVGDYHYTSNAVAITSAENGMALAQNAQGNIYEVTDSVMIKGLKIASGPQLNTSLKIGFFHPKMWFADLTISYFDFSYLDFAPSRRMMGLYTGTRADGSAVNGSYKDLGIVNTDEQGNPVFDPKHGYSALYSADHRYSVMDAQESLVSSNPWNRFMIDASIGKLIYLKNRQSLSINLSVSNLTNNTQFKTGGYQQARLARSTKQGADDEHKNSVIATNVWKYPSKYYYAWGANFFLNVTYKF